MYAMWQILTAASIVIAGFLVSACDPITTTHGYTRSTAFKEHIVTDVSTREEVQARFGSPSSKSSFGEETWYYVSNRQETTAFLEPETTAQNVTAITFNAEGTVTTVAQYTLDDARAVEYASRTTPTEGHKLGILEQMLGNLGQFNKPGRRIPGQGGSSRSPF